MRSMGNEAEGLLERTRDLVPMLAESAASAERERHVLPEVFDALSEAGVLKMCAPAKFGGYQVDFETQVDVLAELARGCPSSSWVATILSAMGWVAGMFPDEAQEEVLGDGDPRISGTFSPTGTAAPADGGLIVNGAWPFATGNFGAKWAVIVAIATGGDEPMPVVMLAPYSELKRLDDWNATGMSATGSSTIVAEDLFVPAHRTQPLPFLAEGQGGDRHNADDPYFQYPLAPVLSVNAAGTPVGIARGALEAYLDRLPGRAITYTFYDKKAEAPITHLQVGQAALKIESADAHMRRAAALLDDNLGVTMTMEQRVKARAHVSAAMGEARDAVDVLFYGSGASSIQESVPIQRFQRDVQALSNHAIMHPATTTELYGRVLCGLEPNTPLY